MKNFKKFQEWLLERETKNEMTTSSAAGGMTSTADIATFARPLLQEKKKKKKLS